MIHVLFPTNFKEDILPGLAEVTQTFAGVPLKVVLFHALEMPTSITELLMLPRERQEEALISTRFIEKCLQVEQELEQIQAIESVIFYGSTRAAFQNFLEANKIDVMVAPTDFSFQSISQYSLNPLPFMEKARLPLISVAPRVPHTQAALA